MNSTDEYDRIMPIDLFDLWKNERLTGFSVSSDDIKYDYLKTKNACAFRIAHVFLTWRLVYCQIY